MSEHTGIQPALTAKQWGEFKHSGGLPITWYPCGGFIPQLGIDGPKLMAISNAALPDDDPRKITREKVEAIQNLIDDYVPFVSTNSQLADGLLDVLRALLPPE